MKIQSGNIILHLALLIGLTTLLVLIMVYPFLPGAYDSLALPLSTMVQVLGAFGLLLVPVGVFWLADEVWKRGQRKRNLPTKARGYYFALTSVVRSLIVALAVSLVAFATVGLSFGLLTLALGLYVVARLLPRLRLLKNTERENFSYAPLYLVFIPVALLLFQLTLAAPLTEFSRNYAITQSAEFINDIEGYHARHGRYPGSLLGVWKDYYPSVVGIEKFHYVPDGDAYNLFFEQPRFLFDNLGTREFVVYNKLDEQTMISHTSWILLLAQAELETRQGWYAVHDTARRHWKYFWFD